MPRLIDADALWEATKDADNIGYMAAMILTAPTIDAVPVVHGRWERMENPYGELEGFMCECGHQSQSATNFCPNCGARMDKEAGR